MRHSWHRLQPRQSLTIAARAVRSCCFDRCQLIIVWMSNTKEVHGKPRLHVSVNLLLEYGHHVARLRRPRRRRRRAYERTSNTASHDR